MIVTKSIASVKKIIAKVKNEKRIGFVPTMGSLHRGHLTLVRQAKKDCDLVVVSIFINPKQFGPKEDLSSYPRSIHEDIKLLKKEGVDLVFCPDSKSMYDDTFSTYVNEVFLSKYLCSKFRPEHFGGVSTIVVKLFNIINPGISYFGQKDYQQVAIVKRIVKDLNFDLRIKTLPIVREADGLAMSSRNKCLNQAQRNQAGCLYRSLVVALDKIKNQALSIVRIKKIIENSIKKEVKSVSIDYISIIDPKTLKEAKVISRGVIIAIAIYIGKTRLIDNMIIKYVKKGR